MCSQDENLKYIERETGAEIVAEPQREINRSLLLLCARWGPFPESFQFKFLALAQGRGRVKKQWFLGYGLFSTVPRARWSLTSWFLEWFTDTGLFQAQHGGRIEQNCLSLGTTSGIGKGQRCTMVGLNHCQRAWMSAVQSQSHSLAGLGLQQLSNRSVKRISFLQVLSDLKHFIRKHRNAGLGVMGAWLRILVSRKHKTENKTRSVKSQEKWFLPVLQKLVSTLLRKLEPISWIAELRDDIIDTSRVFQCNLCAHAMDNQIDSLKDHLKTAEHLMKKVSKSRNGKQVRVCGIAFSCSGSVFLEIDSTVFVNGFQSEPAPTVRPAKEPQVSDTNSVAVDIVRSLTSLLEDQLKMYFLNRLQVRLIIGMSERKFLTRRMSGVITLFLSSLPAGIGGEWCKNVGLQARPVGLPWHGIVLQGGWLQSVALLLDPSKKYFVLRAEIWPYYLSISYRYVSDV